ncbi:MAG: ABC-F family ATP-binding cassette domain-containing protein [Bacteroidetes bacterium]|nr:ABC-F family ATP-binding cassette domain-containing protein [Bacteroidota bacterium]
MIPYIDIKNIAKSYGDLELYSDITFTISQGDKCAIIAKNGAGKSTLLNIIASEETPDSGEIIFRNNISVGFLPQDPKFKANTTILDAIYSDSNEVAKVVKIYNEAILSNDSDAICSSIERMDALSAWAYEEKAKIVFTQLKITNFTQNVNTLSGGERKRVALAMLLIQDPDVFILDEPTNHIDLEMAEWLEGFLISSNKTLLMVTHDRYFLDRVCNTIFEIDQKKLYTYKGNYSDYVLARNERIEQFNASVTKAQNIYRKELEWMRRMPQARGTKAKYRKDAFYETKDKAFSTRNDDKVKIGKLQTNRIGTKIFEAENICFSYDDKVILKDFSYIFSRYQRLGIVGKNGSGKSTFLNILTGALEAQSGTLDIGSTVKFGYYRQSEVSFDENKRVIDVISEIAEVIVLSDGKTVSASQFLNTFLFTPETQYNIVSKLSGGERRRLYLMTVLMKSPNFLVLDEPTNDLDIMTLNILEDFLDSFSGCLIVVSHDRYFMDKVTENLMIFEGNGKIRNFVGNYTQYRNKLDEEEQERREKLSAPIPQPIKINKKEESGKKLTFKEKQEYEAITKKIAVLEKTKKEIEDLLSRGTLNTQQIEQNSKKYSEICEELDSQENRWLELSMI